MLSTEIVHLELPPSAFCPKPGITMRFSPAYLITFVSTVVAFSGCTEPRFPVSGAVRYDDGSPFTQGGVIVFETGEGLKSFMVRAELSDVGLWHTGKYDGGLRAGRYKVRLEPTMREPFDDGVSPFDAEGNVIDGPRNFNPPSKQFLASGPACDKKFLSFETSGLELNVRRGVMSYDVTLGQPPVR